MGIDAVSAGTASRASAASERASAVSGQARAQNSRTSLGSDGVHASPSSPAGFIPPGPSIRGAGLIGNGTGFLGLWPLPKETVPEAQPEVKRASACGPDNEKSADNQAKPADAPAKQPTTGSTGNEKTQAKQPDAAALTPRDQGNAPEDNAGANLTGTNDKDAAPPAKENNRPILKHTANALTVATVVGGAVGIPFYMEKKKDARRIKSLNSQIENLQSSGGPTIGGSSSSTGSAPSLSA